MIMQENKPDCLYLRYPKEIMFSAVPRSGFVVFCVILVLTCSLYPVLKTLCVQVHSAVTGSYVAGYHSVLLVNCPTEQTARDIGRYYWKGEIRDTSEILLLVRTRTSLVQRLVAYIKAVHPYDIPEIISFPIDDGSQHYLKWMEDAVTDI
ncbi:protein CutA homolog isoform X2 [Sinocyclocheilus rhinocerous]|uniref:protein CutA homolog isoform X2 n=1 Tax=Sinocyclocheilus rhinocerous TaxID=307959 RepID=UPI0007B97EFB|nr:PREDICTED: protein CutA homolog isoform X2 [Sinocyclocheilus rhinocerous]